MPSYDRQSWGAAAHIPVKGRRYCLHVPVPCPDPARRSRSQCPLQQDRDLLKGAPLLLQGAHQSKSVSGILIPFFPANRAQVAEFEGCRILLVDKKISTARDIVGILEAGACSTGSSPGSPVPACMEDPPSIFARQHAATERPAHAGAVRLC